MVSPAQIALWILSEYPVPSLRDAVEEVPANIAERAIALREYDLVDKHHDSAAVTYVDSFTADVSAAGFEHLATFVADRYPWPATMAAPSAEEFQQVHRHVLAALGWLDTLTAQHRGDVRFQLDCVQSLKSAVRSGSLGEVLLSHFDQFDPDIRVSVMNIFRDTGRAGSRPQLEKIASSDPDVNVREAAQHALAYVDTGGYSSVELNSGSASP